MVEIIRKKYALVIALFSRISGSSRLIPELESLRFVAILSVFATHLNGYLLAKSQTNWAGSGRDSNWDHCFQLGGLRGTTILCDQWLCTCFTLCETIREFGT